MVAATRDSGVIIWTDTLWRRNDADDAVVVEDGWLYLRRGPVRGTRVEREGGTRLRQGRRNGRAKEEGEKEEEAAARRLFEAWKRALDATIEVPDCEPAINASSPWRGKRAAKGGEPERG